MILRAQIDRCLRQIDPETSQPNFYLPRTVGAMAGLYGNSGAEAVYPAYFVDSDDQPLDAANHNYVMTFAADELPPIKAFWSLSMYDGKTQLFIDNPLDRYLVNSSMMNDLVISEAGSVTMVTDGAAISKSQWRKE